VLESARTRLLPSRLRDGTLDRQEDTRHNIWWFIDLRGGKPHAHPLHRYITYENLPLCHPLHTCYMPLHGELPGVQVEGFTYPEMGLYLFRKSLICNHFSVATLFLATRRRPTLNRANAGLNVPIPLGLKNRPQETRTTTYCGWSLLRSLTFARPIGYSAT
jgi:hypothetical protein